MSLGRGLNQVVLVTGSSGAGHSTAIRALEDLGFEAIDNLPLSMLPRLLSRSDPPPMLALGLDTRNRDFSPSALIEAIDQLSSHPDVALNVLYLEADTDTLIRRFSETRRSHPLAAGTTLLSGILREQDLLVPIRIRTDLLIDTSALTPHDLRMEINRWFAPERKKGPAITVQSFSYKRGLPRGVDLVLDVRFLQNPHWDEKLRALDGRDPQIANYVRQDPNCHPFCVKVVDLVQFLLPLQVTEGKSYLSLAFGCTGGQHRSVFMAETLAETLASDGWQVAIRHRELERLADST